ncbi:MAG: carbohydrate kinase [Nocardioidaceae bacterium]|nr:carbohydrate kinase [Nocardioidaceae bacterium]
MKPVVVVGGINLDTLARIETETVRGSSNPGRTIAAPGGVGRNIAENLARLGSTVRLAGAVGRDHAGDLLLSGLGLLDVDTSRVKRHDNLRTGTYTAVLTRDGDLDIGVADMAATASVVPADLGGGLLDDAGWLVLDGNLRTDTIEHGLRLAAARGIPVVLDPVGVAKAGRLGAIPGVHTFTPNAAELTAWAGVDDQDAAIAHAHEQGVEVVWLRHGAAGSVLHRAGLPEIRVSLPPAEVVDVTGAGDAMLAAYVHRLNTGADLEAAAWFGAAAAWLTVGSPSPVHADLTEILVDRTLEELR